MDFIKGLLGMTGGKHTHRNRKGKGKGKGKRGGSCESGEACAAQFGASSSLSQGEAFAKMTAAYHGGKRTRANRKHRMRGGAADLGVAFDVATDLHQSAGTAVLDQAIADLGKFAPQTGGSRRHRGGAAGIADAFQAPSADLHKEAGTSVLDTAFAQLSKFMPHKGGKRSRTHRKRKHGGALGSSPVDAPSMLLRTEDYPAAFLSPQWTQENVVNPNFRGVDNALVAPSVGGFLFGRRKSSRKATRRMLRKRKASRKSRKGKKSHKCPRGKTYRKTYNRKGRRIFGKCVKK
jgi:hypothetical protein